MKENFVYSVRLGEAITAVQAMRAAIANGEPSWRLDSVANAEYVKIVTYDEEIETAAIEFLGTGWKLYHVADSVDGYSSAYVAEYQKRGSVNE